MMLEVKNLCVNYGAIKALHGISFDVNQGEIITLIGSNGAGKTTTLHSISNIIKKHSGTIIFKGEDITNIGADKIVAKRLVQVPEGRRVFANLSVLENLQLGAYLRKDRAGIEKDLEHVFSLFPRLKERVKQAAGTLSGGEQQMLAIARGLMARPKLLMLDEPSLGLAPIIVNQIMDILKEVNQDGTAILLIEQNARKALKLCDRAYLVNVGNIVAEGTGADLLADEKLMQAYLGQ